MQQIDEKIVSPYDKDTIVIRTILIGSCLISVAFFILFVYLSWDASHKWTSNEDYRSIFVLFSHWRDLLLAFLSLVISRLLCNFGLSNMDLWRRIY